MRAAVFFGALTLAGCHLLLPFASGRNDAGKDGRERSEAGDRTGSRELGGFSKDLRPTEKIWSPDKRAPDRMRAADRAIGPDGSSGSCLTDWTLWTAASDKYSCEANCKNSYSISCISGGSCFCQMPVSPYIEFCLPTYTLSDLCQELWPSCCK